MPTLFVSHASLDDALIGPFKEWLEAHGYNDFFIDHEKIVGGTSWREALRASAGACRLVVCIVTENWLRSDNCYSEFVAATLMGKRVLPLYLTGPPDGALLDRYSELRGEIQGIDVEACLDEAGRLRPGNAPSIEERLIEALKEGGALARIGLDPEAFPVKEDSEGPFPGLRAFEDTDADAAVFYGRSNEIAEVLEELRLMRMHSRRQPLAIIGISGSGKSSLLKAGVIPRLRRETPGWLVLRAFRPGQDPLFSLAEAIARTLDQFGQPVSPGEIRDEIASNFGEAQKSASGNVHTGLTEHLEALATRLQTAAGQPDASILISIDQAEEIVSAADGPARAFCDVLRAAIAAEKTWHVVFTVRTDSYRELQSNAIFAGLEARCIDVRQLQRHRFESVIVPPAKRYGVTVEEGLVEKLIENAPGRDALPLLAFALNRLWRQYARSGELRIEHYEAIGGLSGLIQNAAEQALHGLPPDKEYARPERDPPKRVVELAHQTFIPSLADVNEQGAPVRRITQWEAFSKESRNLLDNFISWRLVARKASIAGQSSTVEITHEAIFREWHRLANWLAPEHERMDVLRTVKQSASSWQRNMRQVAWLDHRGRRLRTAIRLLRAKGYSSLMRDVDAAYLKACRWRSRRIALVRSAVWMTLASSLVGVTLAIDVLGRHFYLAQSAEYSVWNLVRGNENVTPWAIYQRRRDAATLALGSLPPRDSFLPMPTAPTACLGDANMQLGPCMFQYARAGKPYHKPIGIPDGFGIWQITSKRKAYRHLPSGYVTAWTDGETISVAKKIDPNALNVYSTRDGATAAIYSDLTVRVWKSGADDPAFRSAPVTSLAQHVLAGPPDLSTVVFADVTAGLYFWSPMRDERPTRVSVHTGSITVNPSADGRRILSLGGEGTARVWDVANRQMLQLLQVERGSIINAALSWDGKRALTISDQNDVSLWEIGRKKPVHTIRPQSLPTAGGIVNGTNIVVTANNNGLVEIYDTTLKFLATIHAWQSRVIDVRATPDARQVIIIAGPPGNDRPVFAAKLYKLEPMDDGTMLAVSAHPIAIGLSPSVRIRFLSDNDRIAVFKYTDSLEIYDAKDLPIIGKDPARLRQEACAGDLHHVLTSEARDNIWGLKGLPRDVCSWRGLRSLDGWRQIRDRWVYLLAGIDRHADVQANSPNQPPN